MRWKKVGRLGILAWCSLGRYEIRRVGEGAYHWTFYTFDPDKRAKRNKVESEAAAKDACRRDYDRRLAKVPEYLKAQATIRISKKTGEVCKALLLTLKPLPTRECVALGELVMALEAE